MTALAQRNAKNFTVAKVGKRMEQVDASIARYLAALDNSPALEPGGRASSRENWPGTRPGSPTGSRSARPARHPPPRGRARPRRRAGRVRGRYRFAVRPRRRHRSAPGVLVEDGTVHAGNGDGSATIQSNGANGIYLKTNSVGFFNNAGNQIVNNSAWGILCDGPPANPLIAIGPAGTVGTVSGNGAGQISCNIAP
jgi:hypothetical protein